LTKALGQIRAQLSKTEGVVIGFYDTRDYMKQAFEKCNKDKGFNFHFRWFKEKLNKCVTFFKDFWIFCLIVLFGLSQCDVWSRTTVSLASGCHAVCCFVNDDVGSEVLHALHESSFPFPLISDNYFNFGQSNDNFSFDSLLNV
jgi:hypothetical protein